MQHEFGFWVKCPECTNMFGVGVEWQQKIGDAICPECEHYFHVFIDWSQYKRFEEGELYEQ